jgi:glycerol-3-phosphate acyltransferase PlsX
MGVGIDMVKEGKADAFVTMGNTGGAMSIGLARLGRIKGVKRPALTVMLPVKDGHTVLADIGANAECKPEYLLQFAQMGAVYAEKALGISNPRVGLISNGEEAGKGNDLVKATYPLLEASGLNFIGNLEGKELFGHKADVAVIDGFTGNVMVKASEAVADLLINILREELMSSPRLKLGALLAKPAFSAVRKQLDPGAIGAVPLLGLDGLVFVGHGRSDARAIVSAIRMARQAIGANLMDSLRQSIANLV